MGPCGQFGGSDYIPWYSLSPWLLLGYENSSYSVTFQCVCATSVTIFCLFLKNGFIQNTNHKCSLHWKHTVMGALCCCQAGRAPIATFEDRLTTRDIYTFLIRFSLILRVRVTCIALLSRYKPGALPKQVFGSDGVVSVWLLSVLWAPARQGRTAGCQCGAHCVLSWSVSQ